MLLKIHPAIEEALRYENHGTILDGAFATQALDTSGEIIDIKGADISSLNEDGVLNTEHQNPDKKDSATFSVVIGRIIFAKKIFSENDCESERELYLWETLGIPFIYGAAELFDSEDHENAKSAAAIIKHYHRRGLPVVIRYSIEGNTLERDGNYLTQTVARRVAATIKPCNKSSYNALVADAVVPEKVGEFVEKSDKYISTNEMEYDLMIDDPQELFVGAVSEFKVLAKTLTLGSYNGSPGTLTQGSALQSEDLDRKVKQTFLKNQVKAAIRDWNKQGSFKEFLKHRLPDIHEDYIDKFTEMADDIHFVKNESLRKDEIDLHEDQGLVPLDKKTPRGAVKFKGKSVIPGEVELKAGPFQGSKLKLLGMDDKHVYVQPFRSGGTSDVKVNRISRNVEGSHFVINQEPEHLAVPTLIDASMDSDIDTTHSQEQKELMHGINISEQPLSNPLVSTSYRAKGDVASGVYKSAHGKTGLVKPAINYEFDMLRPKDPRYMSTARREAVYHNVAKDFWGLGQHVPTTALFKHPDSGIEHSVMEMVPDAAHVNPKKPGEAKDILNLHGDQGNLDKLAIMDSVMGNTDRNRFNYLVSPGSKNIYSVDNALSFNHRDIEIPQYLLDYHANKGDNWTHAQVHPTTLDWLKKLDPFGLEKSLQKNKVHPDLISAAVSRLLSMQSAALLGKTTKNDILFAHRKFNPEPLQRAEQPVALDNDHKLDGSNRIYKDGKFLVARVHVKNGQFNVLEDHEGLFDGIPEGALTPAHKSMLHRIGNSGYYSLVNDKYVNQGHHDDVVPDLDIGEVEPDAHFMYHHAGARPMVLEMYGETPILDGKRLSEQELEELRNTIKTGNAKLEAL